MISPNDRTSFVARYPYLASGKSCAIASSLRLTSSKAALNDFAGLDGAWANAAKAAANNSGIVLVIGTILHWNRLKNQSAPPCGPAAPGADCSSEFPPDTGYACRPVSPPAKSADYYARADCRRSTRCRTR